MYEGLPVSSMSVETPPPKKNSSYLFTAFSFIIYVSSVFVSLWLALFGSTCVFLFVFCVFPYKRMHGSMLLFLLLVFC